MPSLGGGTSRVGRGCVVPLVLFAAVASAGARASAAAQPGRAPAWGEVVESVAAREPVVALTFDDGPAEPYTSELLDVLAEHGVVATFFLVGKQVVRHPRVVRRMVREGHALGNHSWDHSHLGRAAWSRVAEQVSSTAAAIRRVAGVRTWLFRPPYGELGPQLRGPDGAVAAARHVNVLWSVEAGDWATRSSRLVALRVLRSVRPGAILLLHDGGGDRRHVVRATSWVVGHLAARGYRFVTVPELLRRGR